MKTKLVIGKSEDTITMILDNLSSRKDTGNIIVFNNLNLPLREDINHPDFIVDVVDQIELSNKYDLILGIYTSNLKRKIVEQYYLKNLINVIHNSVEISKTTSLGNGCLINSNVSIGGKSFIDDFVSVNRNVSIGHHTIIEKYCSINPGVNIAGHCVIGEGTTIGIGAQIVNGIKIGKNSIIGAGSIVTRDIPDNVVAWGSPCKVQKYV
ncbi:acetyltransferase [bacterium]|nr:acetyltransferase [bacterium]